MLNNSPIKFGTDGWRGIIAADFTFENVCICAQATADYLKESRLAGRGLVIGYDTRFASEDFARTTAEVICGNGIKVYLCKKAAPTPVVSYGVIAKKAGGAVVITASHNPAQWNGFKYKSENGASAPKEVIASIERNISKNSVETVNLAKAQEQNLIEYIDLAPLYNKRLQSFIDVDKMANTRLKIVVDSMYGAGIGYFRQLLADSAGIEIIEINDHRNPTFPCMRQPEPIAVNLQTLSAKVKEEKADVGIATDGDADRIGIIDENGDFITQLQVYALLALYLLEVRRQKGAIIKTITTTNMIYRLGEIFNVPVFETPVGFKYIAPLMLAEKALIGGEESGGYGFRDHVPERDALLAGLYFIDFMAKTSKRPSQLLQYLLDKVGPHYYDRLDIDFLEEQRQTIVKGISGSSPQALDGTKVAEKDTFDGFRFKLEDGSWLLIRFSGTEPLLRIYAESNSHARVGRLLQLGREMAGV
jgi:alpha-D-glucose phosphate-specific phosphoglucomutase